MNKLYWTLAAAFAVGLAFAAAPASAQTTACTGTLPAGTYVYVSVASGQSCTIPTGVTVTDNVSVASGATLTITGADVDGNLQATGAADVFVIGAATVGGNVILNGTSGFADINVATIGGNVQIINSPSGAQAFATNAIVTGNVLVLSNTSTANFTNATSPVIAENTIGGNLVCTGNTPPPNDVISGTHFPNTAVNKLGQCSGL